VGGHFLICSAGSKSASKSSQTKIKPFTSPSTMLPIANFAAKNKIHNVEIDVCSRHQS
jgi:hypothetical protein